MAAAAQHYEYGVKSAIVDHEFITQVGLLSRGWVDKRAGLTRGLA